MLFLHSVKVFDKINTTNWSIIPEPNDKSRERQQYCLAFPTTELEHKPCCSVVQARLSNVGKEKRTGHSDFPCVSCLHSFHCTDNIYACLLAEKDLMGKPDGQALLRACSCLEIALLHRTILRTKQSWQV